MRVLLKDDLIVLIPESEDETHELKGWRTAHEAHVFCAELLKSARPGVTRARQAGRGLP